MQQLELFESPLPDTPLGGMPRSVQAKYELARQPDTLAKVLAIIPDDAFVRWGHIRDSLDITLNLALTESLRILEAHGDIETQKQYFGSPAPWIDNYLGFEVLYRRTPNSKELTCN